MAEKLFDPAMFDPIIFDTTPTVILSGTASKQRQQRSRSVLHKQMNQQVQQQRAVFEAALIYFDLKQKNRKVIR